MFSKTETITRKQVLNWYGDCRNSEPLNSRTAYSLAMEWIRTLVCANVGQQNMAECIIDMPSLKIMTTGYLRNRMSCLLIDDETRQFMSQDQSESQDAVSFLFDRLVALGDIHMQRTDTCRYYPASPWLLKTSHHTVIMGGVPVSDLDAQCPIRYHGAARIVSPERQPTCGLTEYTVDTWLHRNGFSRNTDRVVQFIESLKFREGIPEGDLETYNTEKARQISHYQYWTTGLVEQRTPFALCRHRINEKDTAHYLIKRSSGRISNCDITKNIKRGCVLGFDERSIMFALDSLAGKRQRITIRRDGQGLAFARGSKFPYFEELLFALFFTPTPSYNSTGHWLSDADCLAELTYIADYLEIDIEEEKAHAR